MRSSTTTVAMAIAAGIVSGSLVALALNRVSQGDSKQAVFVEVGAADQGHQREAPAGAIQSSTERAARRRTSETKLERHYSDEQVGAWAETASRSLDEDLALL